MKETNEYDVLLKVVEVIEKKITLQHDSLSIENRAKIRLGIKKIDVIINKSEITMGDNFNIEKSQVGAVGSNSKATHNNFNLQVNELPNEFDYENLHKELLILRNKLVSEASSTEHYKAIGEIATAEEASKNKDGKNVLTHLKNAGKWAFDKAQEVGVALVTELIKGQLNL